MLLFQIQTNVAGWRAGSTQRRETAGQFFPLLYKGNKNKGMNNKK
jgi:hypothetical protein